MEVTERTHSACVCVCVCVVVCMCHECAQNQYAFGENTTIYEKLAHSTFFIVPNRINWIS